MSEIEQGPNIHTYWVVPGKFLAGPHPGYTSSGYLMQQLLDEGVTTFVDLTEQNAGYEEIVMQMAQVLGYNARYCRLPIRDMDVPSPVQMQTILDTLDNAIATGETVYVHCLAGLGRTGTVVGCYLVRHGLPGEQALQELNRLRRLTRDYELPSPIKHTQIEMVRNWPVGG